MRKRNGSAGPLGRVTALALFTLGTEALPGRLAAAGAVAWLCPLAAGAGYLALAAWLLPGPRRQGSLPARERTGAPERILSGLLLAWGLLLTAAQAARIGVRLADPLRGTPELLTAAVLLLAGWMAAGGLASLDRAAGIFALAIGGAFALILVFGLPSLSGEALILWSRQDLEGLPSGAAAAAETAAVGLYGLVLLEPGESLGGKRGGILGRMAGLAALLALGELLVLGRLGPGLAARVDRPFFQMVAGLGFQGALQRLEELVSALWLPGDLTLLALLLLSLRRLLARTAGRAEGVGWGWLLVGGAAALSLWQEARGPLLSGGGTAAGTLAAGVGILALVFLPEKSSKKEKKGVDKP